MDKKEIKKEIKQINSSIKYLRDKRRILLREYRSLMVERAELKQQLKQSA